MSQEPSLAEPLHGTVDVSAKEIVRRRAVAESVLVASAEIAAAIREDRLPKRGAQATARAAGMLAAKETPRLIPHCHPIALTGIAIDFEFREGAVAVRCEVSSMDRTGPEVEAMCGAMTAALTLYDMVKGVFQGARIESTRLLEKEGGKSGHWMCEKGNAK